VSANRRDFIKFVVAGAVTAGCPIDLSLVAQTGDAQKSHGADVDGEDNRICHQVRDGKVFTRPPVSARHDVVIVGGGVSGLTAAYRLRHRDFLLLEKEPHWGGNAYGMEYEGSIYATGSAFLTKDEHAYAFSKEIGLEPLPVDNSDASIIRGELVLDTWGDGLNKLPYPAPVRESFKKFKKEMLAIDVEKGGKEFLDKPFSDFVKGYPEELKQWWDNFGPSNWGAASEDTAASVAIFALQDMAEESAKDDRYTWPGGLGAITKKLAEILQPHKDRMHTGATVCPTNRATPCTRFATFRTRW
jgi:phytoene dehydrogenase-like protein